MLKKILLSCAIVIQITLALAHAETTATQTMQDGKIVQTITAEGVGEDIETASRKAAENALMQVVGSFVDSQKQIDKRTEIINGVRNETKNLSSSIKEYSQGTIKNFTVISSKQEDGFVRVSAEVAVRIEDFHAYIKKLAEGEVSVNGGLFVKLATEKKQNANISSILLENIITPILKGEVTEFSVSDPKIASEINDQEITSIASGFSQHTKNSNVVIFEVRATLNQNYKKNLLKTLESTGTQKTQIQAIFSQGNYHRTDLPTYLTPTIDGYDYQKDNYIFLNNSYISNTPFLMDVYLFKGSQLDLKEKITNFVKQYKPISLEVTLVDINNEVLQKEMTGNLQTSNVLTVNDGTKNKRNELIAPWQMLTTQPGASENDYILLTERKFIIMIALNEQAASKTQKIKIKLIS